MTTKEIHDRYCTAIERGNLQDAAMYGDMLDQRQQAEANEGARSEWSPEQVEVEAR